MCIYTFISIKHKLKMTNQNETKLILCDLNGFECAVIDGLSNNLTTEERVKGFVVVQILNSGLFLKVNMCDIKIIKSNINKI